LLNLSLRCIKASLSKNASSASISPCIAAREISVARRSVYAEAVRYQVRRALYRQNLGSVPLGVTEDDIDAAIGDSMKLCADILGGKAKTIGMKGE